MSSKTINKNHKEQHSGKEKVYPSKNYSSKVNNKNRFVATEAKPNYHLYLIFIILCIIPFIVRLEYYDPKLSIYNWFPDTKMVSDLFLFYKQKMLILIACIMAIIILVNAIIKKKNTPITPIFIPLILFSIFSILSTVFSKYISICLSGGYEGFESIFVILCYCIIAYYSYLYVNSDRDLKFINYFLIGTTILLSIIGIFQFTGHDLLTSDMGYKLVVPYEYRTAEGFEKNVVQNQVYMTLYNPNYVGTYVSLVIPILTVMLLFEKRVIPIILSTVSIIGLIVCAIGAFNLTSMIGLGIAIILILIFMWRYLFKRLYITIPAILIAIICLIGVNNLTDNYLINKLLDNIQNSKTEVALTDIHTESDCVSITYNDNIIKIKNTINNENTYSLTAYDVNNKQISTTLDASTGLYNISDARFPGFVLGWDTGYVGAFYVQIDGQIWRFTNITDDGTYYYINNFNKLDKMIKAQSELFTDYEKFATNRGYIWSRTIPLIKDSIILGSGPDTFTMVFPQQDYLDKTRYLGDSVLTKPHNQYLQMIIQTGLLSMISFLIFYGIYFISSIRLYIKGRYSSYYSKVGVAIFIGTVSYMVAGLTNDSNINTSPLFWTLIGIGIGVNSKAKTLILEEDSAIKEKKEKVV